MVVERQLDELKLETKLRETEITSAVGPLLSPSYVGSLSLELVACLVGFLSLQLIVFGS